MAWLFVAVCEVCEVCEVHLSVLVMHWLVAVFVAVCLGISISITSAGPDSVPDPLCLLMSS